MASLARVLLGVVVFGWAAPVLADGLVRQLPEDGTWAEYELQASLNNQAAPVAAGTLRVSSVGRANVDGAWCRWIEFQFRVKPADQDQTISIVYKCQLPEDSLKAGAVPADKLVKGWMKLPQQETKEFRGVNQPEVAVLALLLSGPPEEPKMLEALPLAGPLGNIEATGVSGEVPFTALPTPVKVPMETRIHEKAPFGVVLAKMTVPIVNDGKEVARVTLDLKISGLGKDATSALPDAQ